MLRSVETIRKPPSIFSDDGRDAELIALGETFQFMIRKEAAARDRANRITARARSSAKQKSGMRHPPAAVWRAEELKIKNFDKITEEAFDLSDQVGRLIDAIWAIRPRTLDGIKVYAEVARYWNKDLGETDEEFGAKGAAHLVDAILGTGMPPRRENCQRKSLEAAAV